ncbi:inorganic diphosphatase [Synchytrium endobioticum]|uniref:Diphthine--ammonia ligase n=1 Tax=Synchytrium endobioticum TaxID=286115 RepID=A0A507DD84_9FUNG|nr:inorganic diphosphatase [Synchytrium endobioticum]
MDDRSLCMMRVVALVSGGKDSFFSVLHAVANGHQVVALANLHPAAAQNDELDSYMFQTVGHDIVPLYAEALSIPLYRRAIQGSSASVASEYTPSEGDEVEDLYHLLKQVRDHLGVDGVASGAILSNYQRCRVEGVCSRLGLTSYAYLWRRAQEELLRDMVDIGMDCVLVKVAAIGLDQRHLGMSLQQVLPHLLNMNAKYDLHVCGEGGEYETITLDMPLFQKRVVLDETQVVVHSDDAFAPVAYLRCKRAHLEVKANFGLSDKLEKLMLDTAVSVHSVDMHCEELNTSLQNITYQSIHVQPQVHWTAPFLAIGQVTPSTDDPSIEQQVDNVMTIIKNILTSHQMTFRHVVLMHVYVQDLTLFGRMNTVYGKYFGCNPSPRVTVQGMLADGKSIQIDCLAVSALENREYMHVQSISYWAPANIGPYSQATSTHATLYVAGQIGLTPQTMTRPSSLNEECLQVIRNQKAVMNAMNYTYDDAIWAVVYVTRLEYINLVKELGFSEVPICYVVVDRLPRECRVEMQIMGGLGVMDDGDGPELMDNYTEEITALESATLTCLVRKRGKHIVAFGRAATKQDFSHTATSLLSVLGSKIYEAKGTSVFSRVFCRPGILLEVLPALQTLNIGGCVSGIGKSQDVWKLHKPTNLLLVLGNESADLDSIVSATSYAYLQSIIDTTKPVLPVINIPRSEFHLRTDVAKAFQAAFLSTDGDRTYPGGLAASSASDVINVSNYFTFWDDIQAVLPCASIEILLTDHNELAPAQASLLNRVVGIIDHHRDSAQTRHVTPRIVQGVGSCTTLVVEEFAKFSKAALAGAAIDAPLAKWMLSPILMDTVNLELDNGRTTPRDVAAKERLLSAINATTAACAVRARQEFDTTKWYRMLHKAKFAVSHLTTPDLLRKDSKEFKIPTHATHIKLGMASVTWSWPEWTERDGSAQHVISDCIQYAKHEGLDCLVIMTAFEDGEENFQRELILIWLDCSMDRYNEVAARLQNSELRLEEGEKGDRWMYWKQNNVRASRKQVQPILSGILEKL